MRTSLPNQARWQFFHETWEALGGDSFSSFVANIQHVSSSKFDYSPPVSLASENRTFLQEAQFPAEDIDRLLNDDALEEPWITYIVSRIAPVKVQLLNHLANCAHGLQSRHIGPEDEIPFPSPQFNRRGPAEAEIRKVVWARRDFTAFKPSRLLVPSSMVQ